MEKLEPLYDVRSKYGGFKLVRVTFDDSFRSSIHSHEDVDELIYITNGEGIFQVDSKRIELSKGKMLFIESNKSHLVEGKSNLECLAIHLYHCRKEKI